MLKFIICLIFVSQVAASQIGLFENSVIYAKKAAYFWSLDQQMQNSLQNTYLLVSELDKISVITPVLEEKIQNIIKEFYALKKSYQNLNQINERLFLDHLNLLDEQNNLLHFKQYKLGEAEFFETVFGSLADLLTYETLRFFYHAINKNKLLKQKINEIQIDSQSNHFNRLASEYLSQNRRLRFAKSLILLEENQALFKQYKEKGYLFLEALNKRLNTPLTEAVKKEASFWGKLSTYFKNYLFSLKIKKGKFLNWGEYHLSKLFGNIAGSINIQDLLPAIKESDLIDLDNNILEPGDLILEKTKGAITDLLIPGHFGHLALYIGNIDQLKNLSLSNGEALLKQPELLRVLEQLRAGNSLIESVRPGVRLNSIRNFKVTDLAIIRPKNKTNLAEAIIKALSYNNTKYDFAFDVNTSSIVVCSELPFHAFKNINFRTNKLFKTETISPDDVAVLAGKKKRPFELISFFHDTKKSDLNTFIQLLNKNNDYYNIPEIYLGE